MKKLIALFALLCLAICPVGCNEGPPLDPPAQDDTAVDAASEKAAIEQIESEATTEEQPAP